MSRGSSSRPVSETRTNGRSEAELSPLTNNLSC